MYLFTNIYTVKIYCSVRNQPEENCLLWQKKAKKFSIYEFILIALCVASSSFRKTVTGTSDTPSSRCSRTSGRCSGCGTWLCMCCTASSARLSRTRGLL